MTLADRLKISSIMSFSLLVFVMALLVWSSGELKQAGDNDMLADDIQTIIFERATLRDEYFLHGEASARLQWFALNGETEGLLRRGVRQFDRKGDRKVLEAVQGDFDQSVLISQRLVEKVQGMSVKERDMVHHDEFASWLYSQIMLKDSALQQGSAALQKSARERFNMANERMMSITFLLVFIMFLGSLINSSFINSLLRRRLTELNRGVAIIASGDLGYRIDCQGSDELAEFSRVFNSVTGKVQDYTSRLQKSHDLLNDLSSQVPGILFQAYLSPEGRFSTPYVSRGVNDIFDTVPSQGGAAPATIFASCSPDDDQGVFFSLIQSAQTLQPWEHEYRITVPGGDSKWLRGQARPMRFEDGGTLWHGFISDVTERKQAEQLMTGARQQLEQQVQQRTAKLSLANANLTQEIEVRKKVEVELLAQQQKLQEMALDLSIAEERERDRIASELHDQVGQRLILAKIKVDTLVSKLPSGDCETEAVGIGGLIDQTVQDIRSLTFQIRPPLLASAGLEAALRWLGEELRADFGLEVTFSDDSRDKPLRYEVRSTLFQAVRELMLNVAKHAGTKRCHVDFTRADHCIVITVEDDGVGLKTAPPAGSSVRSGGFGLLNVKQKMEHIGGSFNVEAKAAGGTRATINVPLESTV